MSKKNILVIVLAVLLVSVISVGAFEFKGTVDEYRELKIDEPNLSGGLSKETVVENILASGATSTYLTSTNTEVISNVIDVGEVTNASLTLKTTVSSTDSEIYFDFEVSNDNSNWYKVNYSTTTNGYNRISTDTATGTNKWLPATTTDGYGEVFEVPKEILNNRFLRVRFVMYNRLSKIWAEIAKTY